MTSPTTDRQRTDEAMVHLVRRLALAVVMPACTAIFIGIVRVAGDAVSATSPGAFDAPTVPLHELTTPGILVSPLGMLTAGLVAFAALPALTLFAIAVALAFHRRWREVLFTCGVLATLGIAASIGHR